jgi:hypothetical protein
VENEKVLIGIGCNVASKPNIYDDNSINDINNSNNNTSFNISNNNNNNNNNEHGREATCIAEHNKFLFESIEKWKETVKESKLNTDDGDENKNINNCQHNTEEIVGNLEAKACNNNYNNNNTTSNNNNNNNENNNFSNVFIDDNNSNTNNFFNENLYKQIAVDICKTIKIWLENRTFDSKDKVLTDFANNMDYSPQKLRKNIVENLNLNSNKDLNTIENENNIVIPLMLNNDGTLKVFIFRFFIISYLIIILIIYFRTIYLKKKKKI